MAASGILSQPLQLVIGDDMVTGQQERYSVAAKSNSKSEADDQSTINTANSTGSLSSSDETQSSLLSGCSGGSNGAMGLDLTDEGALEGEMAGAGQQGSVYEKAGLMSAAAAAAEAARAVRQHHKLQQHDAMGGVLSGGEMNDPYAMSTPVTTPGATSSCASNSPPAPGNMPRSQSFNGMEGEPPDAMNQFAGYRYQLEQLHMRGGPSAEGEMAAMAMRAGAPPPPASSARLVKSSSASAVPTLLQNAQGYYAMPDNRQRRWRHPLTVGGYGGPLMADGNAGSAEVAELNDRMASMNLRAAQHQQQQQHQMHMAQQNGYMHNQGMGLNPMGGQRMGQPPRSSPMQSPTSDMSGADHGQGSGLEASDAQALMADYRDSMSPSASSGFGLPLSSMPSQSPSSSSLPPRPMPQQMPMHYGQDGRLHDELGRRESDEEGHGGSSDPSSSFGLSMGPFANAYHGSHLDAQPQYSSNPYPYAVQTPPEGMRPRSLSEGSFFYGPQDEGLGSSSSSSQGVYPPGLGPRMQSYGGKSSMSAGIPPQQAQQMVQWISHFVRQKGGVITAANLGSALARLHPDFYSLIKASHGGLTAFLADYPERFSFANDPPFNHVFLSREMGGNGSGNGPLNGSQGGPNLSLHPSYALGNHGPPPRMLKPPTTPAGLPLSLPIRARSMSDPRLSAQPGGSLLGGLPPQLAVMQGQPFVYASPNGGFKISSSPTSNSLPAGAFSPSQQGMGMGGLAPSWPLDQHLESEVVRATAEILCNAASYALKAVELANTLRARLGTKVLAKVREKYGGLLFMLERHPHLFRVDRIPKNDCVTLLPKGLLLVTHPNAQVPAPSPPSYSGGHQQAAQQQQQQQQQQMLGNNPAGPVVSAYAHTIQQLQQQVAMAREKEAQAKQAAAVAMHHQRQAMQHHHQHQHHHANSPAAHLQSQAETLHQRRMGVGLSPLVTAELKARMPTHLPAAGQHPHQPPYSHSQGPATLQPSLSGSLSLVPEPSALQRRHSWSNLIAPGGPMEDLEPQDQAIGPPQGQRSLGVSSFYGAPAPPSFHSAHTPTPEPQIGLGLYGGFDGISVDGTLDPPGPGAALSPEGDEAVGPATSHNSQSVGLSQQSHIERSPSGGELQGAHDLPLSSSHTPLPSPQLSDKDESDGSSGSEDDKEDDEDDEDAASGSSLSPGSEGVGGESNNVGSAGDPMPPQMSMWGSKGADTGLTLRGWDVVDGSVEDLLSQQNGGGKRGPMELGIPGLNPVAGSASGSGGGEGGPTGGATRSQSSGSLSSLYGASPPTPASSRQHVGLGLGLSGVSMCPVLQILTNNHFVPTQAWPAEPLRDSTYVNLIVEELRNVGGTTTVSKLRGLLKHKLGSKETIKSVPLKALLQAYRTVFTLHRNHVTLNGPLRL